MSALIETASAALAGFRFWFLNFPTLVRLTWLPLLVLSATGYAWLHWNTSVELAQIAARESGGTIELFALPYQIAFDGILVWSVLQLIALSAAAGAVHRFVTEGDAQAGEYFAFRFGKTEMSYFAMGAVAYVLMALLVAGQYLAQLTMPPLDASLFEATMKPYAELGPFVLSLFIWPGEQPIFEMPLLNYALWCALVITTAYVIIRISVWPAAIAERQSFALGRTLRVTQGQALPILTFFAVVGAIAGLFGALLGLAGLLSFVIGGGDQIGALFSELSQPASNIDPEVQGIMAQRSLALGQEVARLLAGIFGVTLGATLISHLFLALTKRGRTQ